MSFMPRMTAEIQRIEPLRPLQVRRLDGVVADLWHARGQSGGGGFYISPDPRVVVFLDGPDDAVRLRDDRCAAWMPAVRALYVPPGVPLWSEVRAERVFTHLDVHFDAGDLARRMGGAAGLDTPRFHQTTDRILPIAQLLAAEVSTPRRPDLAMDALLTALLAEILDLRDTDEPTKGGLPPFTLRRLADHVGDNLHRQIGVA
ncbi:MAG: AraC family transcriptional regulator, partial [Rhodobacteraceae bacterium]|nr:AraC family transcriptional regulator [Paracoccaceae bacterium]